MELRPTEPDRAPEAPPPPQAAPTVKRIRWPDPDLPEHAPEGGWTR